MSTSELSVASQIASLPPGEAHEILNNITDSEMEYLPWDWKFWARPKQLPPDWDWVVWLVLAGRGFGKTRTGAELVRIWKNDFPVIHFIGPTASDVRDVMVEGPAGILSISPPGDRPRYETSKRKLTWENGCVALLFSADEPDRLRGPQCQKAWADEPAAWRYPETWDQMMLGLRLGSKPQVVATTTPRPTPLIKDLVKRSGIDVALTRGSTFENQPNLAEAFLNTVVRKYEGTRLGRQELNAEILEDVEGAMWTRDIIERNRVAKDSEGQMRRVVIAVDPSVSAEADADECGIVVAGIDIREKRPHAYVLADWSLRGRPEEWAKKVAMAYDYHLADVVIAEKNNGGEMIAQTIHAKNSEIPVRLVHASRGKQTRAEPVSALYEQDRVHHVGFFPVLEDQMASWVPGDTSPDRMDALVWAISALLIGGSPSVGRLARGD